MLRTMDSLWVSWFPVIVSTVLMYYLLILFTWRRKKTGLPLPPGPSGWPLVGNLFQLGEKPHESLFVLSRQYGPILSLSLGMKTTVVVSSPSMAKEILKIQDHIFAGRTVLEAGKILSHHKSSIIWGQNGPQWRKFRRIFSTEVMSPKRLQALQHLRRDQVFQMLRSIFEDSNVKGKSVNIANVVYCTGLNLLGNMIFSKGLFDPNNLESVEFREALDTVVKLMGTPNLADFFPFLVFLDPQGLRRQLTPYFKRCYSFVEVFIQNRLADRSKSLQQLESEKDFLDVLLDLRGDGLTLTDIRALIFELLTAGSDTTATTIEWAMAELIHNPYQMKRVQQELDEVVGRDRRVEEADVERLPYLRAVVKEVFRLHPAAPLLLHRADSCSEVGGFLIPKDSLVIVNVWGIARDPANWKEPMEFMPQRFMEGENCKVDYKGHDFEFLPFGSGRRMCVGYPLASKMVHLVLASLLHSFEWTLPNGMKGEEMDMSDMYGLVLKKAVDLHAIPTPRLPPHIY